MTEPFTYDDDDYSASADDLPTNRNAGIAQTQVSTWKMAATTRDTSKNAIRDDSDESIEDKTSRQVNISRHINSVVNHFTASKEGYERLLNQLDDLLLVLDAREASYQVLYASGVSSKMISRTADDLVNAKLPDLVHPDDVGFVLEEFADATRERRDANVYCRMKQADGVTLVEIKARPFSSTRSPIPSKDCKDPVQFFIASCREYRNKASQSVDAILELSIEHIRLREQLEAALVEKGIDPATHALLKDTDNEPLNAEILESTADTDERRKRTKGEIFCRQCGTTSSPEWRRGPDGPKT